MNGTPNGAHASGIPIPSNPPTSISVQRIPQFGEMLTGLMSVDNRVRGLAEKEFERLKSSSPESLALHLLEILTQAKDQHLRSFAIVLLRGCLTRQGNTTFVHLSAQTQQILKNQLLQALEAEGDQKIRKKTSEMIGEIANNILQEWPELLTFVFGNLKSPDLGLRECSFDLLRKLGHHVAVTMHQHHQEIAQVIRENLLVPGKFDLSIAVMAAWSEILLSVGNASDRKVFVLLAPDILEFVSACVCAGGHMNNGHRIHGHENQLNHLDEALKILIEVCEKHTKTFSEILGKFVPSFCEILKTKRLASSTRQLALEVLVTMVENKPTLLRKFQNNLFMRLTIPAVFEMMLELNEIPDVKVWSVTKEDEDEEDGDAYRIFCTGAAGLDRIANALGSQHALPLTFKIVSEFATRPEWQARHASLVAISQISEVIPTTEPKFREIIKTVTDFVAHDPHPKVRSAGVAALGNLCVDGAPCLQERHHSIVLPILIDRLNKDLPRIKARAATAIDFFIEGFERVEVLESYLDLLLDKLFRNLETELAFVKEAIVPAISSLAYRSEGQFGRYYNPSMPLLKQMLMSNANPVLRTKIIECIAHIGKAAGKDVFRSDALWLINIIKETPQQNDEERACILSAWCSLCESLGSEFEPYLGILMPSLLQMASITVDYEALVHQDAFAANDGDFNNDARTSDIDDKYTACSMLAHLCHEMGAAFFPFVQETSRVLGPLVLIENELHEDIRATAVAALPDLVASVALTFAPNNEKRQMVNDILHYALEQLVAALHSEEDLPVLMTISQAIRQAIVSGRATPTNCTCPLVYLGQLPVKDLEKICEAFMIAISQSVQRRAVRAAERQLDDYDEDVEAEMEMEMAQEDEFRLVVSTCLGEILPLYKDSFMTVVDSCLLKCILDMSHPRRVPSDRKFAVFLIDDMIEHLDCSKHLPKFFNILMANTGDPNDSLRQAALYGIGVAAEKFGQVDNLQQQWKPAIAQLVHVINAPNSKVGDAVSATDNAISALGKIMRYSRNVDRNELATRWLAHLPLQMDIPEAQLNVAALVDLVEKNDSAVIGHQGGNLPKIAQILAVSMATELVPGPQLRKTLHILDQIKTTIPPDMMKQVWSSLAQEHQKRLEEIVQHAASAS